jgi:hypothetical protein
MKYEVEERNYGNYKEVYIKKRYFNIFSFYVRDSFDFGEIGQGFPILVSGLISLAIILVGISNHHIFLLYSLIFIILSNIINVYCFQLKKVDFYNVSKAEDFIKSSIKKKVGKKVGKKYNSKIVSATTYKTDGSITKEFFE